MKMREITAICTALVKIKNTSQEQADYFLGRYNRSTTNFWTFITGRNKRIQKERLSYQLTCEQYRTQMATAEVLMEIMQVVVELDIQPEQP